MRGGICLIWPHTHCLVVVWAPPVTSLEEGGGHSTGEEFEREAGLSSQKDTITFVRK